MSVIRSFKPAKNLSETSYSSVAINIPGVHKCLSFKNSQEKKKKGGSPICDTYVYQGIYEAR